MEETWKSTTGGVLAIIGGVITLFLSIGLFIAASVLNYADNWATNWGLGSLPLNIAPIFIAFAIPLLLCAILAFIGGICAIQRKMWGLALAGSIAAFFPAWIFGLGSIIFIALSREEFNQPAKPTAAAVPAKTS